MKAPGDSGEWGVEGKREIKHPDRKEREWTSERGGGKTTTFIAFTEMLLKEQNEMDLIKHHLFIVTVYLCDCVYIRNKWFELMLAYTICICEIVRASLGVWAQDWSCVKAHFLNISRVAVILVLALVGFFSLSFFFRFLGFVCLCSKLLCLYSRGADVIHSLIPLTLNPFMTHTNNVLLLPSSLSHRILSQQGLKRALAQQRPVTCHSSSQPSHGKNKLI